MAMTLARRVLVALGICVGFLSSGAFAAVPVVGWGYSVGNAFWGIAPWSDEGAGWWDPPADSILQGRVTLRFDPSFYQITSFGWFGDFAANPSIPAPPILDNVLTPPDPSWAALWHLQAPNSSMTSNVSLDNAHGSMVVTFDWGTQGHTPATDGHFNFFGFQYTLPAGMTNEQLQLASIGDFGPGKIVVVQSLADITANGANAATYMLCSGGFCGVNPIPEASTELMMIAGLGAVLFRLRRRKSYRS